MGTYIVMMGVQGAGKGTQATIIKEKLDLPHVSTGDLFRAMKTQDTPLAKRVQDLMAKGELIPDEVTNEMVKERLAEADAQRGVILDGYPRNTSQAEYLDNLLAEKNERIAVVPLLTLEREIAIKRAEGRRTAPDGTTYNIYFNPPPADIDPADLVQRADDHREAVERRIDLFFEKTAPLIEYYTDKGVCVKIDADQNIDAVAVDVFAAIAKSLMD